MAKKETKTPDQKLEVAASLDAIGRLLHARIGTKWDLIMVSSVIPERVKEFLDQGFEPFAITSQKMPKIDAQTKIQLLNEFEDVNVIWMKRPEILAPVQAETKN